MRGSNLKKNADYVNRFLKLKIRGNPSELYEAASHLIESGGKRLRPYLVLKSCQILGGSIPSALPAAGAIEMIHNFTLVHDDIMDNDEMRHGVPTVHRKYGLPVAILAGDVLFSKAYQIISSAALPPKVISALVLWLAKACVEVCEGQLLDIRMAQSKKIPSQSEYVKMITKKTAALFEVSCSMGAICANAKISDIANLSSFGKNLGIAFQITDDLIGVMGDPKITKKPVGNDLREGKKSLPILIALEKSKGKEKALLLHVFGNHKASGSEIEKALKVVSSLGIEDVIREKALNYASTAKKAIDSYSGTPKRELISLLDFVVERSL